MKKDTSWNEVADWYEGVVEDADSFQTKVILPNLTRIVGPKEGMTILDVACGQGFFTRNFAQAGAKAIGCDISPELIELARKKSDKIVNYQVSASDNMSIVGDSSMDVVTIILALQNIENLAGTMSECSRILKKGGKFVMVLNHPAFRIPGKSSWVWEGDKGFRRIDAYMSDSTAEIDMNPGESDRAKKKLTISFHRPLQSYFKALAKSGFAVTRLEEWISHKESEPGPRFKEENRIRKEIPLFICIESIKRG